MSRKKNTIVDIESLAPDTKRPDAILQQLLYTIYNDLNIKPNQLISLAREYADHIKKTQIEAGVNTRDVLGNLIKELNKGKITWKVFIKILRMLKKNKFDLTITLYDENNIPSTHTVNGVLENIDFNNLVKKLDNKAEIGIDIKHVNGITTRHKTPIKPPFSV